jgi:hypothetical protein
MATFFFQKPFGVEEIFFSLDINNRNNIIFKKVDAMIEKDISLFSIPKNSLNPNIHIISNPNIIIKGNNTSSLGNSLPSLIETKPINSNNIIKPKIIFV